MHSILSIGSCTICTRINRPLSACDVILASPFACLDICWQIASFRWFVNAWSFNTTVAWQVAICWRTEWGTCCRHHVTVLGTAMLTQSTSLVAKWRDTLCVMSLSARTDNWTASFGNYMQIAVQSKLRQYLPFFVYVHWPLCLQVALSVFFKEQCTIAGVGAFFSNVFLLRQSQRVILFYKLYLHWFSYKIQLCLRVAILRRVINC